MLRKIPRMVVGVVKRAKKKTTSKQIGKLNTELRKCLQKKYIGLVANVSLLEDFDDETHQLQTS